MRRAAAFQRRPTPPTRGCAGGPSRWAISPIVVIRAPQPDVLVDEGARLLVAFPIRIEQMAQGHVVRRQFSRHEEALAGQIVEVIGVIDDGIAVVRELVEGERAADHPKVRHQPANHGLEEQFVRNQRGPEERDDVGFAGQLHDLLQARPGQNPPLRAEIRRHVADEATPEPQAALQRKYILRQVRLIAPVEVPAILVTFALRAALDPFD